MADELNVSQSEWNRLRPVLRKQAIDSGISAGEADRALDALNDPAIRNRVLSEHAPRGDREPDYDGTAPGGLPLIPTVAIGAVCLAAVGIKKVADWVGEKLG